MAKDIEELRNVCVIDGTMRTEDLFPVMFQILRTYAPGKAEEFAAYAEDSSWMETDEEQFIMQDLFAALDEIAPEGTTFSDPVGMGYGFWEDDETLDAENEGKESAKEEPRKHRGDTLKECAGTQGRYMSDKDIAAQYADFWVDWIKKKPNGISINVVYPSADEEDYDSSVVFWMKKRDNGEWYDFNGNWSPDDVSGKVAEITDVADKVMGDGDEISFEKSEDFHSWLEKNKSVHESRRPRGRMLKEAENKYEIGRYGR